MIKDIICPCCKEVITDGHAYQRPMLVKEHIKAKHEFLFRELTERAQELKQAHATFNELSGMINYQFFLHE